MPSGSVPVPLPVRRTHLAVWLVALVAFHVAGSWILPLIDRDEPRFAEASREMIERGDWVIPWFNNTHRFDKPPLIYWMQIAAYRTFGESEFAARFPSAVCAALTALVLYGFGRRISGDRAAFWAAALFSTSLQTAVHARAAVADMPMVLCFTAALWAGWEILQRPRSPVAWTCWIAALALGFLAKGPVAWLPVVPLLIGAFRGRRAPAGIALGTLVSLVAAAGVVLLWAWPALVRTDGEFFRIGIGKHVVHRSVDAFEGHGADGAVGYLLMLPFFFLTVFLSFLPGSIFLPWLVRRLRATGVMADAAVGYLFTSVLTVFVVFTLVSTKLPHYTLPAFPALALLLSMVWFRAGRESATLRRTCLAGALAWLILCLPGAAIARPFFPSPSLLNAAAPWLKPGMEFASVSFEEPSLVWYFRKKVRGFHRKLKISQVERYLAQPGPRFVIVPTADLVRIGNTPGVRDVRVQGWNLVNGKRVDLTLRIKED